MNDLIVPPGLIDLPPVLVRLTKRTGADRYDAWARQCGNTMVVFAKDSERFEATLDLLGVVPELRATAGGALRVGLLSAPLPCCRRFLWSTSPCLRPRRPLHRLSCWRATWHRLTHPPTPNAARSCSTPRASLEHLDTRRRAAGPR